MSKPVHIYPLNDLSEHSLVAVLGDLPPYCPCPCDPRKEKQDNGVWLIIHNSFDGREGVEWANEILKGET